ncbi:coagulation factor XI-like [Parambassis ranga]|uniref:Coagulation factor XI-like n=1 Tax=Parambassis ranga TaxID=210632 RepID=A0A6P7KH85_9TELE|nr:coagulation factor XI-like [Parambassis ranga]
MGGCLILMCLLGFCGLTFGQGCNRDLLNNWDFPGNDITALQSPDARHCQYLCTQYPSCQFFTFVRPNSVVDGRFFHCFLKYSASGRPDNQVPKKGLTSGFSLKACNPDPEPCQPLVYQDTEFPYETYKSFFAANLEDCQRACTNDPYCQFFTFLDRSFGSENIRYMCYLKYRLSVPRPLYVRANSVRISGFSQKIRSSPEFDTACEGTLFPNIHLPGDDIEAHAAASTEQCLAFCSAHPRCTHFTYTSGDFRCYLKNNPVQMPNKISGTGVTSGVPVHYCQQNNSWIKEPRVGVEFQDLDIRSFLLTNAAECQRSCTEDSICQFYSYDTTQQLCYLKRIITLPSPSAVRKQPDAISGFSLRLCPKKPNDSGIQEPYNE